MFKVTSHKAGCAQRRGRAGTKWNINRNGSTPRETTGSFLSYTAWGEMMGNAQGKQQKKQDMKDE